MADKLEDGLQLESVQLEKPAGSTGYVLKIPLGGRQLYVKLQLGSGSVTGRSFHYSKESEHFQRDMNND